jgi:hypothetical protein
VAETWRVFHDAVPLRPTSSFIPDSYTVLERTVDLLFQFEEGNATAIIIKPQKLLLLRKTSSIQTSFQILLRIQVKRKLLKASTKAMKKQAAQALSLRSLMMGYISTLGGPTEIGTYQNF